MNSIHLITVTEAEVIKLIQFNHVEYRIQLMFHLLSVASGCAGPRVRDSQRDQQVSPDSGQDLIPLNENFHHLMRNEEKKSLERNGRSSLITLSSFAYYKSH